MHTNKTDRPTAVLVRARCRMLGLSERTSEAYLYRLVALEDWCGEPAMQISQETAAAWQAHCAEQGASLGSLHHNRCALVFLFRHMRATEVLSSILPRPRLRRHSLRIVADPCQISAVLGALDDPVVRLFCQFIYATGMRRNEAIAVRAEDLDYADGSILVQRGKGGRQRRTVFPAMLQVLIRGYRSIWDGHGLLFAVPGRPFSQERVCYALAAVRRRLGIVLPITPHHLRHAFATHLHERGVGVVELQRLLGHTSILTTMHYIGLREARRGDIARIGDLLAALPAPAAEQQRIAFAP